jgi:hypothetical protein
MQSNSSYKIWKGLHNTTGNLYRLLLFSCYPWIGEYYEHSERGEYKPNIRTIRNNTGSNIFIYI